MTSSQSLLHCYINRRWSQKDNQLERKKLSKAFEDFQGHEELKDGLSHCLRQSGALLLESPTHPLHRHVHIISYLSGQRKSACFIRVKVSSNNNIWLRKTCHVYSDLSHHCQWHTCFSNSLYDMLKKSTFTALWRKQTNKQTKKNIKIPSTTKHTNQCVTTE